MKRIDSLDELVRRLDPIIVRRIAEAASGTVVAGGSGGSVALATFDDISGSLEWDRLDFTGSQLSDIASRDHGDLTGITPNQHHNQSHVLATTGALGADHTVSGLTAGQVLQATGASAAKFAALSHGKLTDVTSDQHHPRLHNITSVNDHTIVAAQYNVVGATATDTLGILSSSNNPGANVRLLRSTSGGALTLESFTSNGDIYGSNTAFRAISHTHGGVGHVHLVINPSGSWTLDEQFGVDIDDNLLVRGWIVGKHALQIPDATLIAHFDGMEPFETNHTGEATGSKGQVPTVTGPPLFVAGKFDKCIQISEVGQNLVPQPSFEGATDAIGLTDNWSIFNDAGGDLAASRDITASVYGDYSAKLTAGTINNSQFYTSFGSATSGQPYTASVWLKASIPINVTLRMRQHSSPYTSWGTTTCAVTTTWQRFQLTVTAPATVGGRISIEPQAAGSVWVDAVQVENKSYATHYMDGSLGGGCSWDGTAWNSTSSRAKSTLRYEANDDINPVQGSVGLWFRIPYTAPNTDLRSNCRMFEYGHYTSPVSSTWIAMVTDDDHSNLIFYYYNGSTGVSRSYSSFGSNCCDGEWHLATMTWGDGYLSSYMDGVLISNDAITVTQAPSDQTYIGVGNNRLATENFPSIDIDDFMIVNRVLDADEVRAIYESNAPVFAESSTWHWRAGQNLIWADAEGLWMFNVDGSAVLGAYGGDGAGGTKTWGGVSLETSDILIGDETRGGYIHWDDSAGSIKLVDVNLSGYESATKFYEIDPANGIDIQAYTSAGTPPDETRAISWWPDLASKSGYPDTRVYGLRFNNDVTASFQAFGDNTASKSAYVSLLAASRDLSKTANLLLTETYGGSSSAALSADTVSMTAGSKVVSVSGTIIGLSGGTNATQPSSTGAIPTLALSQSDLSEEFIDFVGTVSAGNPIETAASLPASPAHKVRVAVNGTFRYLYLYAS